MNGKRWLMMASRLLRHMAPLLLVLVLPAMSAGVEVGEKAPDFELPSTMGGKIRLSDFAGRKNVILEFHVLDFAPV
ncbi:MAG: redoxin domain-containing protein [candidate division NC10 bacterium]|nr:redoxin domain-containing protein [candidate division NC10 bacterium]